jgi:hypothetical protein
VSRHLAQLAATLEMFVREKDTLTRIGELGVEQEAEGVLMYANDEGVEFYELSEWWTKRAGKVLNAIA